MSSALVREALAFVDPDESVSKKGKKSTPRRPGVTGQDHRQLYKKKTKKTKEQSQSKVDLAEENIKKLLALSKPTADTSVAEQIVERAVKGKPLIKIVEVKPDEGKSILFPDDPEPPRKFQRKKLRK